MHRVALAFAAVIAATLACEGRFCDRPDMGTCGNACCKMSVTYHTSTEAIMSAIATNVEKGGPDGRYTPEMTYAGTLLWEDLRPYKIPGGVDFIGQMRHRTKVHSFNDTINMVLKDGGQNVAIVEAFSVSGIGGAYGDSSQNYANIMNLLSNLSMPYEAKTVFGCPAASSAAPASTLRGAIDEAVGAPLHASCKANFTFSANTCDEVSAAIVKSANTMSGLSNCGSGEKCGYSVTSSSDTAVSGKHETPVHHYFDDYHFDLSPIGTTGCEAGGFSSSETWYAVLDDGTNLCDMKNLIAGTGLTNTIAIDEDKCTQWKTANCDKY